MRKLLQFILITTLAAGLYAQPTNNAPTPPARNSVDVISIYGGVYTNIGSTNFNPVWGQSGTVNIAYNVGTSDLVMEYKNFNYQGTGFEALPQNASAMQFVHIDIWTNNATNVKFTPIDNSGAGPSEVLVEVPLKKGMWNSVDLPKSAFTGMSWNSLIQLKFDGQGGVSPSDIYLDNIYFWKPAASAGTDATLSDLQVNGAKLPGFTPSAFTYSLGLPGGSAVPTITLAKTSDTLAKVTTITQATAIPGDATVLVTAANGTTKSTYKISFFYNSPVVGAPIPGATKVISLYSDSYTNVKVDTWNTSWSQAAFEEVTIAGNKTYKYTNLGFNGIETTSNPIDATAMKFLHMDVWTPNISPLNVKLVSFLGDGFGGAKGDSESNLNATLIPYQWNQIKIPLADFTAAGLKSLADLNQFILTSTPFGSGTLFVDNVYFSDGVTSVVELDAAQQAIYPNPVTSNGTLTVSDQIVEVAIYSLNGQKVLTSNATQVNINGMNSGIYLVKLTDKQNKTHSQKLIVE